MYVWHHVDDATRAQMNSELRRAQLELMSAQCATDWLRLRYTVEEIARDAERELLRKAIGTAVALSDYYLSIQNQLPTPSPALTELQVQDAVKRVGDYLWKERESYRPQGVALTASQKTKLGPFFSKKILDNVRTVELRGRHVAAPPFYTEAQAMGFEKLPKVTHMASLTFIDVIVFNDLLIERALFHGLVHAVQFDILGLECYAELFVRGFLRSKPHLMVPLETHTFALESKFALASDEHFSVEEQVRLWIRKGLYRCT